MRLVMITTTPSGTADAMRKSLPTASQSVRAQSVMVRTMSRLRHPPRRPGGRVSRSRPQQQQERPDRPARGLTMRLRAPCLQLHGLSSVRAAQSQARGLPRPRYAHPRSRELAFVSSHRKSYPRSSFIFKMHRYHRQNYGGFHVAFALGVFF